MTGTGGNRGRGAAIRMLPAFAALALIVLPLAAHGFAAMFVPALAPGAEPPWHQVRIEQHIIIRIAPGYSGPWRDAPPPPPMPQQPDHFRRRPMPPCMAVAAIAGVRPMEGNRLMLFMRDRRLVGAELARHCSARDFYQGFYVSANGDGLLCAGRDTIHSRSGATCAIAKVHELVPTG